MKYDSFVAYQRRKMLIALLIILGVLAGSFFFLLAEVWQNLGVHMLPSLSTSFLLLGLQTLDGLETYSRIKGRSIAC